MLSRTIKLIECNMKDFSPGELNQVIGYVLGIKEHHIITQCPRRKGTLGNSIRILSFPEAK